MARLPGRGFQRMGRFDRSRSAQDINAEIAAPIHMSPDEARSYRRGRLVGPGSVLTSPNRNPVGVHPDGGESSQRGPGRREDETGVWWRGASSVGHGYIPRVPMPQEVSFGPAVPVTANQVKMGLPPGVVVYPDGGMRLTATTGATFKPFGGHFECLQFGTGQDGDSLHVIPRVKFTKEDLVRLRDHFHTLRMVFPVR